MTATDCYCYCCTCGDPGWDPACRNHGAHGVRACTRHNLPGADCDCGCEDDLMSELVRISQGPHPNPGDTS